MGTHPSIVEANQANFQSEVIQRSYERPVVVDFWAPWCGPCRMLGPVLERLANEPGSGFTLAKVNADYNPQLSQQYGVRGIPAVKAFVNGRIVNEFVGAQPEPRVRQFIQSLPQAQGRSETAVPPSGTAGQRVQRARDLLRQGNGCAAQQQLSGVADDAARQLLPLAQLLCDAEQGRVTNDQLRQAAGAAQRRDYSAALYTLLLARQDRQQQAAAVMKGIFALLGEDDPLVQAYQAQV